MGFIPFEGVSNVKFVGWKKKRLSEIADVIMGQSPKSEFYNQEKIGLPFHQGVGSYGSRFVTDSVYSALGTKIAEANSMVNDL